MKKEIILFTLALLLVPTIAFAQANLDLTPIQNFSTSMTAGSTYTAKYNIKSSSSSATPVFFTLYVTTTTPIEASEFSLTASINGFVLTCTKTSTDPYQRNWESWKCMNGTSYYYFPAASPPWLPLFSHQEDLVLNLTLNVAASPQLDLKWKFDFWVEDTLPPEIILESRTNGSVIKSGIILNFTIRDNVELSQAWSESQLLYDNFDDGNDNGWTQVLGTWSVENGEYSQDSGETYTHYFTTAGDSSWQNYTVEARLKVLNKYGTINAPSILVRFQDTNNFYMCQLRIDQNELYIVKKVGGAWSILSRTFFVTNIGEWHTLKCKVENNKIFAYLHNSTHGISNYTTDNSILNGKIGLNNYNTHTHFDNISVVSVYPLLSPYDFDTSSWAEGLQSLTIHAIDIVGNQNRSYFEFIVDNTPPKVENASVQNITEGQNEFKTVEAYDKNEISKVLVEDYEEYKKFDFGNATSPVEAGYTRVTKNTIYSVAQGYGWSSALAGDRDRVTGTNLTRDLVFDSSNKTFNVDLPSGDYMVILLLGDTSFAHDRVFVQAEGGPWSLSNINTSAGQVKYFIFNATVNDDQLNVLFSDKGGSDPNWASEGMIILRKAVTQEMVHGSGNKYNATIVTPKVGFHVERFLANDTVDNTNNSVTDWYYVNNNPRVDSLNAWGYFPGPGRLDDPNPGKNVTFGTQVRIYAYFSDNETNSSNFVNVKFSIKPNSSSTWNVYENATGSWEPTYKYWYVDWIVPSNATLGYYDTRVYAEDGQGGSVTLTEYLEFGVVDLTPPRVENSTVNKTILKGENETIVVSVWDDVAIDKVLVEDNKTTNYTMQKVTGNNYTVTIPNPSLGNHSLRYYANDSSGNMNSTVYDWFNVTLAPPPKVLSVNIIPSVNNTYVKAENITFNITFDKDMNTSVPLTVTYGNVLPYNNFTVIGNWSGSTKLWSGYSLINSTTPNGNYTLNISGGMDYLGNIMVTNTSKQFIIDTIYPFVTSVILSPSNSNTYVKADNVKFNITFSQNMDTSVPLKVSFNTVSPYIKHVVSGSWVNSTLWSGSYLINSNTTEGWNTLNISAGQDLAGNIMQTNTSNKFYIDKTPPTLRNWIVPNISFVQNQTITVQASDSGSGIADVIVQISNAINTTNYTMQLAYSNTYYTIIPNTSLTVGINNYRFFVSDRSGNVNNNISGSFTVNGTLTKTGGKIAYLCRYNPVNNTCNDNIEKQTIKWLRDQGWNVSVNKYNSWNLAGLKLADLIVCSDAYYACKPTANVINAHKSGIGFVEIPAYTSAYAGYKFGYVNQPIGFTDDVETDIFVTIADSITAGYMNNVTIYNTRDKGIGAMPNRKLNPITINIADYGKTYSGYESSLFKVEKNGNHGRYAWVGWFYGWTYEYPPYFRGWTPQDLNSQGQDLLKKTLNWAQCENAIGCKV